MAVSTSKGIPAVTAAILETVQLISQSVYLIRQALESIRHEVIAPIDGILSNIEWATHRLATWQATHVELQPEIERMLHSFSSIRSSAFWIDVLLASLPPLHRNIELQLRKASVAEILHSYFGLLAAEAQERRVRCQIEHESLPMIRADLNHLRRAYKHHTFTLLGMQAGHHLLDVGCGTGEDVRALARLVGSNGRVVGLDIREELIAEARKRAADTEVEFYVGDIYRLNFADNTFDGCRADRVFQHLSDPHKAVAEMMRVVRSGPSVVVADPDWETLVIDSADRAVTRRILNFNCGFFAHGWMGRQLPGLFRRAGLREVTTIPVTHAVTDFVLADHLFFLQDTVKEAQAAGLITNSGAIAWLDDLTRASREGCFFSALTLFVVGGRKP